MKDKQTSSKLSEAKEFSRERTADTLADLKYDKVSFYKDWIYDLMI